MEAVVASERKVEYYPGVNTWMITYPNRVIQLCYCRFLSVESTKKTHRVIFFISHPWAQALTSLTRVYPALGLECEIRWNYGRVDYRLAYRGFGGTFIAVFTGVGRKVLYRRDLADLVRLCKRRYNWVKACRKFIPWFREKKRLAKQELE